MQLSGSHPSSESEYYLRSRIPDLNYGFNQAEQRAVVLLEDNLTSRPDFII